MTVGSHKSSVALNAPFLLGGEKTDAFMRTVNWDSTPLGSPERWPQPLRAIVGNLLASRLPFLIMWGPELLMLYNDSYAALIGDKHPRALGHSAREAFPEIWDVIGPMFEGVMRTVEATSSQDQLLKLQRRGFTEECYFTFSYSPMRDEDGRVAGILTLGVLETTSYVLNQRRLGLLRKLGEGVPALASTRTAEICTWSAETITSDPYDIPFALIYLLEPKKRRAELCASAGIEDDSAAAPKVIAWDTDGNSPIWPVHQVAESRSSRVATLPDSVHLVSPWNVPVASAYVMPIVGAEGPAAVLITGLSPHLPFDENYRSFIESISADIGVALSNASSYQALEEVRERLSVATAAANFGVFDWDSESDTNTYDRRYREIFGLPLEGPGMTLKRFSAMVESDDSEMYRNLIAAALKHGELHATIRFRPLDGERRWLEIHGKAIPASSDRGRRIVGVVRDITGPKRDEERLLASENRYKTLVDALPDGILINRNDRVVFANRAFAEMIGARDYTELLGRDPFDFLHPDYHPIVRQRIKHLLETGEANPPLDQHFVRVDGKVIEVEAISTPYDTIEGRAVQLLIRDIGARKQAALAQMRLAAIVESSEDAIVGKDLNGSILSWNAGAERIFGYTAEEIIGRSILTVVPPDLAHEETEILSKLARNERIENFETIRVRKGGERFPVSLTISPIKNEHGRVVGASKIARDITDRKRIEREREELLKREQAARSQAEEASRIKDEFLATVSHELRAPLSAISGWAHVLGTTPLKDSDRVHAVEAIQRGVQSQTQLISDLLDVSRIVAGKMRLDIRSLKLVNVLEQAIDTVRPAADAKRVRLQVILDPAAEPLSGDSDRLQQVFWNLLSNAIKFTPSGGRVELRSERINSHVEITVSDNGIGIRPEVLPFVFDRFRQADSAITRKFGGLGLGLAIVRHLVELHGGTVSADSLGEDQGATFIVRLPAAVAKHLLRDPGRVHPAVGGATLGDAPQLDGLRLLVVDDEPGTREVMQEILRRAGAEVRAAASAAETLEILDEWQPDVLLSDIGMPAMDGYGLIREIRARPASKGGRIPAAALTAYSRTEDRLRALSAGFQMHLPKPVEPVELLTVIASLARRF